MKTADVEVGFSPYEVVFRADGEAVVMDGVTGEYVSPHSNTGKLAISLAKDKIEGGEA